MAIEYKRVNAKAKGLTVFQAFDTASWSFDYRNFVVADAKTGPDVWQSWYPCRSYGAAVKRLEMCREQAAWQVEKAKEDKAAKAAAAKKAKEDRKAAAAAKSSAPKKVKDPQPDLFGLMRAELQAEMQAAIAKGVQEALAQMTTAPAKPESTHKQANA